MHLNLMKLAQMKTRSDPRSGFGVHVAPVLRRESLVIVFGTNGSGCRTKKLGSGMLVRVLNDRKRGSNKASL